MLQSCSFKHISNTYLMHHLFSSLMRMIWIYYWIDNILKILVSIWILLEVSISSWRLFGACIPFKMPRYIRCNNDVIYRRCLYFWQLHLLHRLSYASHPILYFFETILSPFTCMFKKCLDNWIILSDNGYNFSGRMYSEHYIFFKFLLVKMFLQIFILFISFVSDCYKKVKARIISFFSQRSNCQRHLWYNGTSSTASNFILC